MLSLGFLGPECGSPWKRAHPPSLPNKGSPAGWPGPQPPAAPQDPETPRQTSCVWTWPAANARLASRRGNARSQGTGSSAPTRLPAGGGRPPTCQGRQTPKTEGWEGWPSRRPGHAPLHCGPPHTCFSASFLHRQGPEASARLSRGPCPPRLCAAPQPVQAPAGPRSPSCRWRSRSSRGSGGR